MEYELFYLVGASQEAELEQIKSGVSEVVTSEGGVFNPKQVVEKRRLAYEVRHETHGFYIAQRFILEDMEKIPTITKNLNLYSKILRFIVSRSAELPELASREERKNLELRKSQSKETPREAIPSPKETAQNPKQETDKTSKEKEDPKKPEVSDKDLDKELEEILNI